MPGQISGNNPLIRIDALAGVLLSPLVIPVAQTGKHLQRGKQMTVAEYESPLKPPLYAQVWIALVRVTPRYNDLAATSTGGMTRDLETGFPFGWDVHLT